MRWASLVLALAACEPETGVVHDGDTDIVLVDYTVGAECAQEWQHNDAVAWEVPEGTVKLERYECVKEHADDPEPYVCNLWQTLDDVDEDGFLRFECRSIDGEILWRIDYTAPRQ